MYSKYKGKCDGCAPDGDKPYWMHPQAAMVCVPCELELCQNCHETKHKLHCSEPPEMYSTKFFFHPEIGA